MSLLKDSPSAAAEPAPREMLIRLTNAAQCWHLHQALRGHCEVDLLPNSEGTVLVIASPDSGRPILRRIDAWLTEFGVETVSLEIDGRTYELKKTPSPHGPATR